MYNILIFYVRKVRSMCRLYIIVMIALQKFV